MAIVLVAVKLVNVLIQSTGNEEKLSIEMTLNEETNLDFSTVGGKKSSKHVSLSVRAGKECV
jgi:hypothetical protein